MLYYDDRDYYNSENIDELYDDEYAFAEDDNDSTDYWEFDYHNLTDELVDD